MTAHTPPGRDIWLDVLRGIGILSVVTGHCYTGLNGSQYCPESSVIHEVIYWFHMPLFFAISGYLFRPVARWNQLPSWLSRRAIRLLVPYTAFAVAIVLIYETYHLITGVPVDLKRVVLDILLGGRYMNGPLVVFWFVICLYLTQLLHTVLWLAVPTNMGRLAIIAGCYALAHIESAWFAPNFARPIPLSADTALLALSFHAMGYGFRTIPPGHAKLIGQAMTWSLVVVAALIALRLMEIFVPPPFNMRDLQYGPPLLDLALLTVMALALVGIAQRLTKLPRASVLAFLGTESMVIMYVHFPANLVARTAFDYGVFEWLVIGTGASLVVGVAAGRTAITRRVFQGTT